MTIALLRAHLHMPSCQSLKDKRSILKGIIHRLRAHHNCAVAEVDDHDLWQSAVLAIVTVYHQKQQAESLMESVERYLETLPEAQLAEVSREFL